jgi:hypothetical protein
MKRYRNRKDKSYFNPNDELDADLDAEIQYGLSDRHPQEIIQQVHCTDKLLNQLRHFLPSQYFDNAVSVKDNTVDVHNNSSACKQ